MYNAYKPKLLKHIFVLTFDIKTKNNYIKLKGPNEKERSFLSFVFRSFR
jgi:hypothetical protein